jgi:CRISPR type IV-associated protein Csf3
MDSHNFQNLQITAVLRTAVISDQWLPLDGLLLYQQTRDELGAQEMTTPGTSSLAQPKGEAMKGGKLPIKTVHSKEWYYRCSWAQWSENVEAKDYWNKRYDNALSEFVTFGDRRGTVNNAAGQYKAYHQPVFYRSALWVRWYCVGVKAEIERLLSTLTHIGKKSAQGWGRVARWEVESIVNDWSIWKDEKLMRGIPSFEKPNYVGDVALYGVRPSYWDRRNQIMLVLP